MSVLAALDATRICSRRSADPSAWANPVPVPERTPARTEAGFSWRSLIRNPHAILVTGLVGTAVAADTVLHRLPVAGRR